MPSDFFHGFIFSKGSMWDKSCMRTSNALFFRHPRLVLLGLAASLPLLSCSVGGPTSGLDRSKIPSAWLNTAAGNTKAKRSEQSWWRQLNDSTLTQLISTAYSQSPDLKSYESRIREAIATRQGQASGLFPSLTGSLSGQTATTDPKHGSAQETHGYSAGLSASWEVDLFGKTRSSVYASHYSLLSTEETFHSAQVSLAAQVAAAYTDLRLAEAKLKIVRESVQTQQETYDLTHWREQAGNTDALDTQQVLSSLEQAKASIATLEQSAQTSRNLINRLCGKNPGELDSLLNQRTGVIPPAPSQVAIGIPADVIRQRPDIRAAAYTWVAATYTTHAAELERLPSLNLSGTLGVNALSTGKLFSPTETTSSLIAGLTGPIFDAGKIRSGIRVASEQQEQALQSYSTAVLQGLSDVEDSLIACRATETRTGNLTKAASAATEAQTLAKQKYQAGTTDLLTVLDTQRTALSTQQDLATTQADRTQAYISLYKAIGGSW
jgi:outer membrane protein, multidrug efflux system